MPSVERSFDTNRASPCYFLSTKGKMENWCYERLFTFQVVIVITLLTINSDHVLRIYYVEVTQHIVYTLILSARLSIVASTCPRPGPEPTGPTSACLTISSKTDLNTNLPDTSAQIFSLHHTNLTEGSSRAVINYLNLQSLEWQSQIFMVGPFLFTVDKKKKKKETRGN